jgi:NhaP-type Na+/H+ or K+/H+ antiporter
VVVGTSATLYFRFVKYNNNTDMEALVLIFTAYTSFLLDEVFHLSGILAALVCGIWCAVVTDRNLSDLGDDKSHTLAKQFAGMAEMVLFVLSGMMTVLFIYGGREPTGGGREHFNIEDFFWPFFLCTLGLILVARALALFPLGFFRLGFFGFRTLPALTLVSPVGFATICFFLGSLHIEGFILPERDGQEGVLPTPMGRDLRK